MYLSASLLTSSVMSPVSMCNQLAVCLKLLPTVSSKLCQTLSQPVTAWTGSKASTW